MENFKISLLKLSLFCFFLTVRFSYSQNLVLNPGFENGNSNWILSALDLKGISTSFGSAAIDNTVAHSGASSLRCTVKNSDTIVTALGLQYIALKKGGHYMLQCYVKTDSVFGQAEPLTEFIKNGKQLFADGGFSVDQTTDWKLVQYRFTPPQDCDSVELFLWLVYSNSGTAWFDDISITELKDTTYSAFSVNFNSFTGTTINTFMSVNVGPIDPSNNASQLAVDLTPQFQQLGVQYVRTHDFEGPCDMLTIFPDTNRNALDSSAYNFVMSDSVIKAIINAGCKVFFRLGNSDNTTTNFSAPPANYEKWAQVCLQIVRHYNAGWDQGFHYGIKYWEIFNEPDGAILGGTSGLTTNDYIKLYRLTALSLKNYDTTLRVGGPALAGITSKQFLFALLDSVKTENLPFDFFSYHYYHTMNPYDFVFEDRMAQKVLTQYGFGKVERIVSEWNNNAFSYTNNYFIWRDDPFVAANTIASLSYYQNTTVSKLFRYRSDGSDLGMFYANGDYDFSGLAYYFFSDFNFASNRLTATGSDTLGSSILAGQSPDASINAVMISNNNSAAGGYTLNLQGLGNSRQYSYQIFRIDSTPASGPVASGVVGPGSGLISQSVKSPFVDMILFSSITGINNMENSGHLQTFPNPFSDKITIRFELEQGEQLRTIEIMDLLGRPVKTFVLTNPSASFLEWDGTNDDQQKVSGGIFVVKLVTDNSVYATKILKEL